MSKSAWDKFQGCVCHELSTIKYEYVNNKYGFTLGDSTAKIMLWPLGGGHMIHICCMIELRQEILIRPNYFKKSH
jgi:hypothetical protein